MSSNEKQASLPELKNKDKSLQKGSLNASYAYPGPKRQDFNSLMEQMIKQKG